MNTEYSKKIAEVSKCFYFRQHFHAPDVLMVMSLRYREANSIVLLLYSVVVLFIENKRTFHTIYCTVTFIV